METKAQRSLINEIKSAPELARSFTVPVLAWPTVLIYFISFIGFGLSTYAFLTGMLSPFITVPISAFFVFGVLRRCMKQCIVIYRPLIG